MKPSCMSWRKASGNTDSSSPSPFALTRKALSWLTLYTIDPVGLAVDPGVYGSAAAFNDPFGGNYQFNGLSKATGGRALYGRNDVDAEIGTAIQDGSNFYTLTYRVI
jgi:hypothetical protein